MIRTVTLTRRSNNMMEGVLQMSKTPNPETHSPLQTWQCDQESGEYDNGSPGHLLSTQVAAARLASSSPDSGHESDLLAPELHNLESGGSLLSNAMSSGNPTANFIIPKPSIWGTGDSEYSWPQESLSRSSGTVDDSSLLSSDTLGNDTSRLLESSKTGDSLIPQWPPNNSQSSATSIHTSSQVPYQRRSWQSTSDDDHPSLGLLIPNMNLHTYSHSFPALSSASGFDAPKFNMDYLGSGERSLGANFEATSVYDSMARKIQNQMSGLDASSGSTTDMSSIGFSALPMSSPAGLTESSDNTVSSGLFSQHGLLQQRKNYGIGSGENGKNYLTSNPRGFFNQNSSILDINPIVGATAASNQRLGANVNSPKLLLESLPGNSVLNNISSSESILGSQNYLYSTQKKADPLESSRKWPMDAGVNVVTTGTGLKDFPGNNSGVDNPGRFSYTVTIGDNEDGAGLYDSTSWTTASVGQQSNSVDLVPPGEDSRKRFLHMSLGQPSDNNSNKRRHMETQNGQVEIPPAPLKRSSSWASSLTSTCSKGQDTSVVAGSALPYTKSNSRHAVGPALNTNLKPRARQGSANDPQSIAARHRRERISERLKVLQDLVPNGSKVDLVTMLEKAINYVKFLQLQVKVLTTDDYWPSNEKGAAPCTALPNFEDMEGALKVLVAQAEKEANTSNNNGTATSGAEKSPESEDMELGSPGSSESL